MKTQRYRKLSTFLQQAFGRKVYKVGVCGGFTCPNRDGTISNTGCLFCNPDSSRPYNYESGMPLSEQLEIGTKYIQARYANTRSIIYFQDYTTTYGRVDWLAALYREAITYPGVVGLAMCTRPDCLSQPILDLLTEISRETFLWVELGIQTASDTTLQALNRCHTVKQTRLAVAALRERNIAVSGHVILGLPGENDQDLLATAQLLVELEVHGIKLHNLHVVTDTPLAELYHRGEYEPLTLSQYINLAIKILEHLPPSIVIQRICGEAHRELTVAPEWSVKKTSVVNAIDVAFEQRDTWQGKALGASRDELLRPVGIPGLSR